MNATNNSKEEIMIVSVDESNIAAAAAIHSASWQESHRTFCSPEFVALHTPERQTDFLRQELADGKRLYMLIDSRPVGIVSVKENLIKICMYFLTNSEKDTALRCFNLPSATAQGYLRFGFLKTIGQPALCTRNTAFTKPDGGIFFLRRWRKLKCNAANKMIVSQA